MNGVNISNVVANGKDQPFYFIHGGNDNPGGNFYPYRDQLENAGAIINWKFLPGVGHTIDFNDNLAILTEGYRWIDSVNCDTTSTTTSVSDLPKGRTDIWSLFPNPMVQGSELYLNWSEPEEAPLSVSIFDVQGRLLYEKVIPESASLTYALSHDLEAGVYFLSVRGKKGQQQGQRLIVKE